MSQLLGFKIFNILHFLRSYSVRPLRTGGIGIFEGAAPTKRDRRGFAAAAAKKAFCAFLYNGVDRLLFSSVLEVTQLHRAGKREEDASRPGRHVGFVPFLPMYAARN